MRREGGVKSEEEGKEKDRDGWVDGWVRIWCSVVNLLISLSFFGHDIRVIIATCIYSSMTLRLIPTVADSPDGGTVTSTSYSTSVLMTYLAPSTTPVPSCKRAPWASP